MVTTCSEFDRALDRTARADSGALVPFALLVEVDVADLFCEAGATAALA
jgi:hypothetical protein